MTSRLQLSVRAENLKNVAGLFKGVSDPYAVVTVTGGVHSGKAIGKTTTIKNSLSPEWPDVFIVDFYRPGVYTEITVEVYDENRKMEDRMMGRAEFQLSEVLDSVGSEKGVELERGGTLFLHATESIRGSSAGRFEFQLRALHVKNIESGVLGLGVADPFFEISKKFADHASGVARWYVVYRSEQIMDTRTPLWEEASIGLEELCHCDLDWPLKISVLDWQKNGKHRPIGEVETTAAFLMQSVAVKGNADRGKALEILSADDGRVKEGRGKIVVLAAKVRPPS